MSRMNLSLVVSAQDQTQSALRSAMGGLASLARAAGRGITVPLRIAGGGLGLLRDIQQGLRPALGALDGLIERGARLKLVEKAFGGLAQVGAAAADRLAKRIQAASGDTLRLAEAMRVANRGMSLGLDLRTIVTATEFAARKAVTLGEEPGQLLERILMDLGKGTTRVLDDIGLMRDGVEGVARAYDRINGSGAFSAMSESAKKAEIARVAVAEMARDMRGMRVTLGDVGSGWQRLKVQVGDALDRLVSTFVHSPAMQDVMGGLSAAVAGAQRHFAGGGSLGQLLRGKDGDGGLLGVARAALGDLGAAIGEGASKAFAWVRHLLPTSLDELWMWREMLIDELAQLWSGTVWPQLMEWRTELIDGLARILEPFGALVNRAVDAGSATQQAMLQMMARGLVSLPAPVRTMIEYAPDAALQSAADPLGALRAVGRGLHATGGGLVDLVRELFGGDREESRARFRARLRGESASAAGAGYLPGLGVVPAGAAVAAAAMAPSRTAAAWAAWRARLPGDDDRVAAGDDELDWLETRGQRMLLRPQARLNMQERERRRAEREWNTLAGRSSEGLRLRGEARRQALEMAREAARAGYQVTPADRQRFEITALAKLEETWLKKSESDANGEQTRTALKIDGMLRELVRETRMMTGSLRSLVATLGGEEAAIAAAAP